MYCYWCTIGLVTGGPKCNNVVDGGALSPLHWSVPGASPAPTPHHLGLASFTWVELVVRIGSRWNISPIVNVHICGDFEGREASDSPKEAQTANSSELDDTQGGGNQCRHQWSHECQTLQYISLVKHFIVQDLIVYQPSKFNFKSCEAFMKIYLIIQSDR